MSAVSIIEEIDSMIKLNYTFINLQLETSVPRDRFDSVCSELESALRREQQVQVVLKEQSGHLERLTSQLDTQNSQDYIKDNTMAEVVQVSDRSRSWQGLCRLLAGQDHDRGRTGQWQVMVMAEVV